MADDPRIDELLDNLYDSSLSPEEACRAHPELMPELLKRLYAMTALEAQLDAED